jgi:hypothetical protein
VRLAPTRLVEAESDHLVAEVEREDDAREPAASEVGGSR